MSDIIQPSILGGPNSWEFSYDQSNNATIISIVKPLGSTRERHVSILPGDQTKEIESRLRGEKSHLPNMSQDYLMQIRSERGVEFAQVLVNNAVEYFLLSEGNRQIVFYIDQIEVSQEYVREKKGEISYPKLIYNAYAYTVKESQIDARNHQLIAVDQGVIDRCINTASKEISRKAVEIKNSLGNKKEKIIYQFGAYFHHTNSTNKLAAERSLKVELAKDGFGQPISKENSLEMRQRINFDDESNRETKGWLKRFLK